MKTIIEEWAATDEQKVCGLQHGMKFFLKEAKIGKRASKPNLIYLLMEDDPPIDLSEVEMFSDLMNRSESLN
jgi:hypothetical protein